MFRNFSFIILIGVIITTLLVLPFCVAGQAGGKTSSPAGGKTTGKIENPLKAKSFTELIRDIIDWLVAIGIGVAVIMIIYSGLLFMTAAGDEEKVTKAKKALTWSLIGLAVLIMGKAWIALIKDILGVS